MLIMEGVEPCTYCGVAADSIDHIPSRCMRAKLIALGEYSGVWKEVPACRWCNSTLGRLALLTIDARRQHIKASLRRKFRRLLKAPMWSEPDIAELGVGMQGYMRENMEQSRVIRARLAWEGQRQVTSAGGPKAPDSTERQPEALKRPSRTTFVVNHPAVGVSHIQFQPAECWNERYRHGCHRLDG
jgi:hypothetical protein